jgi:hypothetical protein
MRQPIGIGRGLTASPLPHHRTYGSRLRRCGRLRQGATRTPTGASAPGVSVVSSSQASDLPANASPDTIGPLHSKRRLLSTVRVFPPLRVVRCRLLTSAGRSGRIAPPSVRASDTPPLCRGQRSDRRGLDAGCITYAPAVDGGLHGRVPVRPDGATPRRRFVSLAPPLCATRPSDPTARGRPGASLVLRRHAHLERGLVPPSMTACPAHTLAVSGGPNAGAFCPSAPLGCKASAPGR